MVLLVQNTLLWKEKEWKGKKGKKKKKDEMQTMQLQEARAMFHKVPTYLP